MDADAPTRALADYVASATYEQLPPRVTEAAKGYILDSVANMIGGARTRPGEIVLEQFGALGGASEATIIATGQRVPSLHAAYVNASLSNLLDFDDTYRYISHPGATIVPAALAVGEKRRASGRQVIAAVVVAYEVSLRICDAIRPTPARAKQAWGMSTWQIFGAATAAASVLGLDARRVAVAFGHAGMSAPVPFLKKVGTAPEDRPIRWLKNNFGWATMGGVLAADLAARGMHGTESIFDGPTGFWVMAGSDRCDFDAFRAGLGERYLMSETGIKPYACCRWTHTALDAVRDINARERIDPKLIESVEIVTTTEIRDTFGITEPEDVLDAQLALPVLVALELTGQSSAHGITPASLRDPLVRQLVGRIRVEATAEADRQFNEHRLMPASVVVRTSDGARHSAAHTVAKGEPERPLNYDEIRSKFMDLAASVVGAQHADRTASKIDELDSLETIDFLGAEAVVAR
jgi:2-methylcitrate dehydratase PrpD